MGPLAPHVCDCVTVAVSWRYCSFPIAGCLDFSPGHIWAQITLCCGGSSSTHWMPIVHYNHTVPRVTTINVSRHFQRSPGGKISPIEQPRWWPVSRLVYAIPSFLPTDCLRSVCPAFSPTELQDLEFSQLATFVLLFQPYEMEYRFCIPTYRIPTRLALPTRFVNSLLCLYAGDW